MAHFPEEFGTFLLTDPRVREAFLAPHADLLEAEQLRGVQATLRAGEPAEVLSYTGAVRFAPPVPGPAAPRV